MRSIGLSPGLVSIGLGAKEHTFRSSKPEPSANRTLQMDIPARAFYAGRGDDSTSLHGVQETGAGTFQKFTE
jgi:hypothetical protein